MEEGNLLGLGAMPKSQDGLSHGAPILDRLPGIDIGDVENPEGLTCAQEPRILGVDQDVDVRVQSAECGIALSCSASCMTLAHPVALTWSASAW